MKCQNFPGGSVVKNPPTSAGDKGLIPDLGRSHMRWSISPGTTTAEPVLSSLGAATTEAHAPYLGPLLPNKRGHCNEKP